MKDLTISEKKLLFLLTGIDALGKGMDTFVKLRGVNHSGLRVQEKVWFTH